MQQKILKKSYKKYNAAINMGNAATHNTDEFGKKDWRMQEIVFWNCSNKT